MKNLDFAIAVLAAINGGVNFNVFGPIEDRLYWADCQRLAERLPGNVRLRYRGLVKPDEVAQVLERHHLFFLPTRGESFGHAIVESLMAGCPVLISDQVHSLAQLGSTARGMGAPTLRARTFFARRSNGAWA